MAENNDNKIILETQEYKDFLAKNPNATVESFLASMSPAEKDQFYGKIKQTTVDEAKTKLKDVNVNETAGRRVRSRTSDENEVVLDNLAILALKDMGKNPEDLENLTPAERAQFLEQLNKTKEVYLEIIPPHDLVKTADALIENLKKGGMSAEDKALKESQLRKIEERMMRLALDYADGKGIVDQLNIADVYDGFSELLEHLEKVAGDNSDIKAKIAVDREKLEVEIKKYDDENGISGLENASKAEKKALEKRLDEVTKAAGAYRPNQQLMAVLDNMVFVDKDGKPIPQHDDKGNIIPESELAAILAIADSELIKTGTFSDEAITPEWIAANGDRILSEKIAALVSAELISKGITPQAAADVIEKMSKGEKMPVAARTVAAATASHVNTYMGFVNRVGTKVGKDSPLVAKLYEPIKKIDALAEKRWGKEYARTRQFMSVISFNMLRAGGMSLFCNSVARIVPYGSMVAAGVGFAVSVGQFATLYSRQKKHFKSKGENYNFFTFLNKNKVALGMAAASTAFTALGIPEGAQALKFVNMGRSGINTFIESGKQGDNLFARLSKTVIAGGSTYAVTYACEMAAEQYIAPHLTHTETTTVTIPGKEEGGLFIPGETENVRSTEWNPEIVQHAHDVLRGVGRYEAAGERWTQAEMDNGLDSLGVDPAEYHDLAARVEQGETLSGTDRLTYNKGNDAIVTMYRINHADELMPVAMRNDGYDTKSAVEALRHGEELTQSQHEAIERAQEVIRARTGHAVEARYINNGGVDADRIADLSEVRSGLKSYRPGDDLGEDYKEVEIEIKYNDINLPPVKTPDRVETITTTTELADVVPYLPADNLWMARHTYLAERAGSLTDFLQSQGQTVTKSPKAPDNNPPKDKDKPAENSKQEKKDKPQKPEAPQPEEEKNKKDNLRSRVSAKEVMGKIRSKAGKLKTSINSRLEHGKEEKAVSEAKPQPEKKAVATTKREQVRMAIIGKEHD